jgi:hypothetical protein
MDKLLSLVVGAAVGAIAGVATFFLVFSLPFWLGHANSMLLFGFWMYAISFFAGCLVGIIVFMVVAVWLIPSKPRPETENDGNRT